MTVWDNTGGVVYCQYEWGTTEGMRQEEMTRCPLWLSLLETLPTLMQPLARGTVMLEAKEM